MTVMSSEASVTAFREAMSSGDLGEAGRIAALLDRSELSVALLRLTGGQVESVYTSLADETLAALVRELRSSDAAAVLRQLSDLQIADVIDELPPDDAADIIAAIKAVEPARVEPILVEMDRAGDVQALLVFLPETAGGRMTTDVLAVPPESTAQEAIEVLRQRTRGRGSEFRSYVYVTDEAR